MKLDLHDPVGLVRLTRPGGKRVDVNSQRRAGRPQILWFREKSAPEPEISPDLLAEIERLEARLYLISAGAPPDNSPAVAELFTDSDGSVAAVFGVSAPSVAVLDTNVRLAGRFGGDGLESAIELCRILDKATPDDITRAAAPVLLVPDVLEPALCERLISYWDSGRKLKDAVTQGDSTELVIQRDTKRRTDVFIGDNDLIVALMDRVGRRVLPEIKKAFMFDVAEATAFRIGCYEAAEGGFFARHRDNTAGVMAHRQFALTINLNGGYDGGTVRFPEFGRARFQAPVGGALVFSCSLVHEVAPVTDGRRFGVFGFLYDDAGAKREAASRDPNEVDPLKDYR